MAEFNKVSYSKSGLPQDFSYEEQLINNLIQVDSKRCWTSYRRREEFGMVIFEYNVKVVDNDELSDFEL